MEKTNATVWNIVGTLVMVLFCAGPAIAAKQVEQWTRFEDTFQSTNDYDNPVREAKLRVEFTSPSSKKRTILAFWDGGRTWRVRFSPDELGKWSYRASCSDQQNK